MDGQFNRENIMNIAFVLLAVTLSSDGEVEDYQPVTLQLYSTQAECKDDQPNQLKANPQFAKGYAIVCGEVQRDSEY